MMEYYSALKKKEILLFVTMWMDLEDIILGKIAHSQKNAYSTWGLKEIFFKYLFIFIYLAVLCLSYDLWDLVPWPGIEPRPPALGVQSFSHWTTREVPEKNF